MNSPSQLIDRVYELEVTVAFQNKLLHELNEVVTTQQKKIDDLENSLKKCIATISDISQSAEPRNLRDEIPPHY